MPEMTVLRAFGAAWVLYLLLGKVAACMADPSHVEVAIGADLPAAGDARVPALPLALSSLPAQGSVDVPGHNEA